MDDGKVSVRFHDDALLEFLNAFDPQAERYRYARLNKKKPNEAVLGEKAPHEQAPEEMTLDEKIRRAIYAYEAVRQQLPQQNHFGALYRDLRLIYGDYEPIRKYLEIYNLVHTKLLNQYLQIPGLGKLFTSQYFRYEWDMHLGINYDRHALTNYRDHFIHQVKNVHAMFVLLEEFGFLDDITKITKGGSNVIATYILNAARQYARFAENSGGNPDGMGLPEIFEKVSRAVGKPQEELYIERIVLSSAVMAGLFHDIGYPIEHSRRRQKQLEEYLPTISYFLSGSSSYSRISSLLGNTLLYAIVSKEEIHRRYEEGDHGTLSALAFLLYFYESGTIYGLDPIQKAAVDLAALTIYNHTLRYEIVDEGAKDYYRPVYYRNPVSFLFRICDDLQEWQRLYFHLVNNRNWRICQNCLTPVVHRTVWDSRKEVKGDVRVCGCYCGITRDRFIQSCQEQIEAKGLDRSKIVALKSALASAGGEEKRQGDITISNIRYRRLNHIKLCDWGEFRRSEGNGALTYEVHYDCYGLLQMAAIDPSFAPRRADDFRKLRRLLKNQDMPMQLVVSFVSTNPITLKVKILDDFLRAYAKLDVGSASILPDGTEKGPQTYRQDILLLNDEDRAAAQEFYEKYSQAGEEDAQGKAEQDAADLAERIAACFPEASRKLLRARLEVYAGLLQTAWAIQDRVVNGLPEVEPDNFAEACAQRGCFRNKLITRYHELNNSSELEVLLEDFRIHAADGADFEKCLAQGFPLTECYEKQYAYSEDGQSRFCTAVKSYTSRDTYHPFQGEDSLDFYADLYAFYVLSRTTAALEDFSRRPKAAEEPSEGRAE